MFWNNASVQGRTLTIIPTATRSVIAVDCNPHMEDLLTAPFNNMRTLKFKAQPTNAFFATVNQMFAGSSQLSTAVERAVMKSLCRVQTTNRVW